MSIAQNNPLCKITYDRSAREYIVRNGREIARFPSGPKNKTRAQWAAIEHDSPAAAKIARDLVAAGADEVRAIKAARLYIEGKVDLAAQTVASSDGERVYSCWSHHCDCDDFDNGQRRRFGYVEHGAPVVDGIGVACKHTLARTIAQRIAAEVERRQLSISALAYQGHREQWQFTGHRYSS